MFNEDGTIDYTTVEVRYGRGFYGHKEFRYEYVGDGVTIWMDKYTMMSVLRVTEEGLILFGQHEIHNQPQSYNIDIVKK
jgi:hypothetical protein